AIPPAPLKPFSSRALPFEYFSTVQRGGQCRCPAPGGTVNRPGVVRDAHRDARIRLTVLLRTPSMETRGIPPRMATIDEELGQLERDIRQLKIEYDQYFGGGRKRPPTEIEWRIDQLVKRYAERGGELKFHQRFRFNNLSQTYAKYKDIFRKKVALKEEGKIQRHFGAAAKEIEAARAKKEAEDHAAAAGASESKAFRITCSEPERETEKVEQLYQAFLQAKQTAGEETRKLSRSSFNEFVLKKTKELRKQKNCRDVEYVVEVVEGQVKLKALVKS
ncbi:MAG TPA: MXAN_5187 C-terminal domain-containing protein, partial [Candidatus Acidoferrum sp.]